MDYLGHQDYLVHQLQAGVSDRLDTTNANLAATNANLTSVSDRVSVIENLTTDVNERIDAIDGRVDSIDTKVGNVDTKIDGVDTKVDQLANNVYTKAEINSKESALNTAISTNTQAISSLGQTVAGNNTAVNKKIDDHIGDIKTSGADAHFTTGEKAKFTNLLTDITSYAKLSELDDYYTKSEIETYLSSNYLRVIPEEYVTEEELNVALGNMLGSEDIEAAYYNRGEIDGLLASYATTSWTTSLLNNRLSGYVTTTTHNTSYNALNENITSLEKTASDYKTSNDKEIANLKSSKLAQSDITYSPTVNSSTNGSYKIGQLTVKDNKITLYGKDFTGVTMEDVNNAIANIEIPEIPEFPEPVIPDDRRTNRCVIYAVCSSRPDRPTGGSYRFDTKTLDMSKISALKVNGVTQTVGSTTVNDTTVQTNKWITTYVEPTVTMRVWTTSAMFVESLEDGVTATNVSESDVTWDEPIEIVNPNVVLQRVPISSSYGVSVYTKYDGLYSLSAPQGGKYSLLLHTLIEPPSGNIYDEVAQKLVSGLTLEWTFFPPLPNGSSCNGIDFYDSGAGFTKPKDLGEYTGILLYFVHTSNNKYTYSSPDGAFSLINIDGCTVVYNDAIPEYKQGIVMSVNDEFLFGIESNYILGWEEGDHPDDPTSSYTPEYQFDGYSFMVLESSSLGDNNVFSVRTDGDTPSVNKTIVAKNAIQGLNLVRYDVSGPFDAYQSIHLVFNLQALIVGKIHIYSYDSDTDITPKWYNTINEIPTSGPIWVSYNNYITTTDPITERTVLQDENGTGWTIPVKYIDIDGTLERVKQDVQKNYEEIATVTKQELRSYTTSTKQAYENAAEQYEKAKEAFESIEVGEISAIGIQLQISQLRGEIHTKGWNIGSTITAGKSRLFGPLLTSTPYFKRLIGNILTRSDSSSSWVTAQSNVSMDNFTLRFNNTSTTCYVDVSDYRNPYNSSLVTTPIRSASGKYIEYARGVYDIYDDLRENSGNILFVPISGLNVSRPTGTTGDKYYNGDIFATSIDNKDIYYSVEKVPNRVQLYSFRITDAGGRDTDAEQYLGSDGGNNLVVVSKDSEYRIFFIGSVKANGDYSYVDTLFDAINAKYGITAMKSKIDETSTKLNNATFEVDSDQIKQQVTETFNSLSSSYVKQSTLTQTADQIRSEVYSNYGNIVDASYINLTSTGLVLKALSGSESDTLYRLDMTDINNGDIDFIELGVTAIKINHVYINDDHDDVSFLCWLTSLFEEDFALEIISGSYKNKNQTIDISKHSIWWNDSKDRLEVYLPTTVYKEEKDIKRKPLVQDIVASDWIDTSDFTYNSVKYTNVQYLNANIPIFITRYHNTMYDTLRASVIKMSNSGINLSLVVDTKEESALTGNTIKGASHTLRFTYGPDGEKITGTQQILSADEIVLDGLTIASSIAAKELNIDNKIYLFGDKPEDGKISKSTTTNVVTKDDDGNDKIATVTTYESVDYSNSSYDTNNKTGVSPTGGTAWFAAGTPGMAIFNTDGTGQLAGGLVRWGDNILTTDDGKPLKQFALKVEGIVEATGGKLGTNDNGYWTITDSGILSPLSDSVEVKLNGEDATMQLRIRLDAAAGSILCVDDENDYTAWRLNADGSGLLSGGQIRWDNEKGLKIDSTVDVSATVKADSLIGTFIGIGDKNNVKLDAEGKETITKAKDNVTETTENIGTGEAVAEKYGLGAWFNLDGSGSLARGKIWWDKYGNTNLVAKGYISSPVVEVTQDKLKALAGNASVCRYYDMGNGSASGDTYIYSPFDRADVFSHYHDFKTLVMYSPICDTIITTSNGDLISSAFAPTNLQENDQVSRNDDLILSQNWVGLWLDGYPHTQNTAASGRSLVEYLDLSALTGVYQVDFNKLFGTSSGALTIVLPSIEHEDGYRQLGATNSTNNVFVFKLAEGKDILNGNCWLPAKMCYVAGEPESNLDQIVGNIITFLVSNSSSNATETCLRLVGIFDGSTGPVDNYINTDKTVTYVRGFIEIPNEGYVKLQCCSRLRKTTNDRITYDYYWHILSAGDNDVSANKFTCGENAVLSKLFTYR